MLPNNFLLHNRYRIEKRIGKGSMGAVYKAGDERLNITVAVKEALVNDIELLSAFKKEAQRLAGLRHPGLPNVIDHLREGHRHYLVMEYVEGYDLQKRLRAKKAPFEVAEVLEWGDQLLAVLEYLHTQTPPVIHRDIKPHNLKVMPDGTLILLDFGLSKGGLTFDPTSDESVYGYTKGYAPLEQIKGTGTEARSDLYAVGATLWRLVTNKPLIDAQIREEAALKQMPDPLRPANEVNPNVPASMAQIISQALALDLKRRPVSATAMRARLRAEYERQQREEARRRAEYERQQREEARRRAEYERQQREEARRRAEYERQQQEIYDKAPSSTVKPKTPLSPWNPFDHLRLLWSLFMAPEQLKSLSVEQTGNWLASTLTWLPLILLTFALAIEILPRNGNAFLPSSYLWMSGGYLLAWLITPLLEDRVKNNARFLMILAMAGGISGGVAEVLSAVVAGEVAAGVALIVTGIIAASIAGSLGKKEAKNVALFAAFGTVFGVIFRAQLGLAGGVVGWVVLIVTLAVSAALLTLDWLEIEAGAAAVTLLLIVGFVALAVAQAIGELLTESVPFAMLQGAGAVIAAIVGLIVVFGIVEGLASVVEKSIQTGHPSWLVRAAFGTLIAAYAFLLWFSFLAG